MRFSPSLSSVAPTVRGPRAISVAHAARPPADMMRWIYAPLFALAVLFMSFDFAEAKRMGGGKSFGSKDSYSKGYDKQTPPGKGAPNQQPNPAPGGFMSRFGGMGGMLGGLLVGGMLGSLLFGGAGGGFGMMEILLLGIAGFLLFRFIRSRRATQATQAGQATQAAQMAHAAPVGGDRLAYAAAPAGNCSPAGGAGGWGSAHVAPVGPDGSAGITPPVLPAGFDEAEFLAGAKGLYARLQSSWDRRDLADIRGFTSPEVFDEISRQADEDPTPGKTDIVMVEARIIEAGTQGTQTVISVLYDVLLRENQTDSRPTQVREVWHFRKDESDPNPYWMLEGIQQLDR